MAASCSLEGYSKNRHNPRRSKPSKRIDAARVFLKNISLVGRAAGCSSREESRGVNGGSFLLSSNGLPRAVDQERYCNEPEGTLDDDRKLINDLAINSKVQFHHSTSVANTNIYQETSFVRATTSGNSLISRSKSYLETSSLASTSKDRQHGFISQHNPNIHLLDGNQFLGMHTISMSRNRTVFISPNGLPLGSMSVIPYKKEDKHNNLIKEKRVSTAPHLTNPNVLAIEGVEVGDAKKTVSYNHMLVPGLSRKRRTTFQHDLIEDPSQQQSQSGSAVDQLYHPYLLDDPELTSGKHRKVLNLKSYTVSVIQYGKPAEIKKDINERFKESFPNANITLSKLRSIKLEILDIGMKCGVDRATIAYAHIYFEKLVLKDKVTKANRKCCAGACLLLASKFNGDVKRGSFSPIIEAINDRFRLHLKDLLTFEVLVLIALEFQLCLPPNDVTLMYKRLETLRTISRSRNRNNHRS